MQEKHYGIKTIQARKSGCRDFKKGERGMKNSMMKKVLSCLLAGALVLSFTACSSGTEEDKGETKKEESKTEDTKEDNTDDLTFALAVPTLDNPYFVQVQQGFEDKCKELGVKTIVNGSDYDSAQQFSQFENYVSAGAQAILVCPVDAVSLEDAVDQVHEAGGKVMGIAQGVSNADANNILDDYAYGVNNGEQAAKWINTYLKDEAKVKVCLITLDHVEQVKLRGDGMEDTIKEKCPNAEIVYRQKAETMEEAMNVAETALQANPDIKVIACVNDQHALGAWQAVQNLGLNTDDFYIGGGDYTDEAIEAMKDPKCAIRQTTDIQPYQSAQECAQRMYDMVVNGEKGTETLLTLQPHWQEAYKDLENE